MFSVFALCPLLCSSVCLTVTLEVSNNFIFVNFEIQSLQNTTYPKDDLWRLQPRLLQVTSPLPRRAGHLDMKKSTLT